MYQKDLQRIKSLRYIDDDFFTVCLNGNIECTELIIQIILGRKDIKVRSVQTQYEIKNLQGRSAILDVHAVDSNGREFDVEMQRADKGAGAKRARYNSSLLDSNSLKPGEDTEKIPDGYVIFITENDVLGYGKPVYFIERCFTVDGETVPFGDGSHIVYVNGRYHGEDEIGKLMHDFFCANPDDMNYGVLAERARYFKEEKEGVASMCKILEDMCREVEEEVTARVTKEVTEEVTKEVTLKLSREMAVNLIKLGEMPLEKIAMVTNLSLSDLEELEKEVMQLV